MARENEIHEFLDWLKDQLVLLVTMKLDDRYDAAPLLASQAIERLSAFPPEYRDELRSGIVTVYRQLLNLVTPDDETDKSLDWAEGVTATLEGFLG